MLVPLAAAFEGDDLVIAGASNDNRLVRVETMPEMVRWTNLELPARLTGVMHLTELAVVHAEDAHSCCEMATVEVTSVAPMFIPSSVNARSSVPK
jgi:hypothetical protein